MNNILAAEFQAFVLLSNSLNKKINSLKNQTVFNQSVSQEKPDSAQLRWSVSISKCVEICYALFLLNAVNDGEASLKQIAEKLGEAFNIDLSEYAQSMKYIKKRKREGLFLLEMADTLFQFISNSNQ